MSDLYNSIRISSVRATALTLAGLPCPPDAEAPNPVVTALAAHKGVSTVDRVVLYNPDAIALWLYQKYTPRFAAAALRTDLALPMLSVMPSVTPVCFASMYSGVMPEVHGIRKYTKPVLTVPTLFDDFIAAGRRAAIVSTAGDSISKIFLERKMDYFIYDTMAEVNQKAMELLDADIYDLLVIYNVSYDSTMHKLGPEDPATLAQLDRNVAFFGQICDKIHADWKHHNVLYGFCPDHGCHEIDGGAGSHGLDMEEDMNVIHFYGIKPAK